VGAWAETNLCPTLTCDKCFKKGSIPKDFFQQGTDKGRPKKGGADLKTGQFASDHRFPKGYNWRTHAPDLWHKARSV
jgi:hypothetical protein